MGEKLSAFTHHDARPVFQRHGLGTLLSVGDACRHTKLGYPHWQHQERELTKIVASNRRLQPSETMQCHLRVCHSRDVSKLGGRILAVRSALCPPPSRNVLWGGQGGMEDDAPFTLFVRGSSHREHECLRFESRYRS